MPLYKIAIVTRFCAVTTKLKRTKESNTIFFMTNIFSNDVSNIEKSAVSLKDLKQKTKVVRKTTSGKHRFRWQQPRQAIRKSRTFERVHELVLVYGHSPSHRARTLHVRHQGQ